MEIWIAILYCLSGFFLLYWCGNKLVDGAIVVAKKYNVSSLFIGVAIIGLGTSLPEILSTASAARMGKSSMVLGNVIGSNIANIGLVLAIGLLLVKRFTPNKAHLQAFVLMIIGMVMLSVLALGYGEIGYTLSILMLVALFGYLYISLQLGKKHIEEDINSEHQDLPSSITVAIAFVLIGLVGLVIGADITIQGAVEIAKYFGMSERIIGLTLVAIGTSLPEIAATIAAARHGNIGMALGNVTGSNVFNALGATGVAGMVNPVIVEEGIPQDLIIMILFGVILSYLFLVSKPNTKALAYSLLTMYTIYIISLVV